MPETSNKMYNAVCVSECPPQMVFNDLMSYNKNSNYNDICKTNTDVPNCDSTTALYITQPQMGYCVPEISDEAYEMIQEELE